MIVCIAEKPSVGRDIAQVLGVSHARASQIHTRAIQKLKVLLGSEKGKD